MRVKAVLRFKNYDFIKAREDAGFPTTASLSLATGIGKTVLSCFENFKRYPSFKRGQKKGSKSKYIPILEGALKRPIEMLFDDTCRIAVDAGAGKKIEIIKEVNQLPEWATLRGLLPGPDENIDSVELRKQIEEMLDSLTGREAEILKLHFGLFDGNEHTLQEIADEKQVSGERVRQIEAKALRKLKHPSRSKRLRSFIAMGNY